MANVTITVDGDVLQRARIRALQQGTTVIELLRDYLLAYLGETSGQKGLLKFVEEAESRRKPSTTGKSGGRTWTRDELHER